MNSEHYVTLSLTTPEKHALVQSRVLSAVIREFANDERGPVTVAGFDRARLEKELARAYQERDEYRDAWLKRVEGGVLGPRTNCLCHHKPCAHDETASVQS